MQTDNFDDAIRRKVQSINHTYTEEDIDRIQAYANANKAPVSFWKTYATVTAVSFFGLVISGLLFLNYSQMMQQKALISKIEDLQNKIIGGGASSRVQTRPDTVRVVKYITQNEAGQVVNEYEEPVNPHALPLSEANTQNASVALNEAGRQHSRLQQKNTEAGNRPLSATSHTAIIKKNRNNIYTTQASTSRDRRNGKAVLTQNKQTAGGSEDTRLPTGGNATDQVLNSENDHSGVNESKTDNAVAFNHLNKHTKNAEKLVPENPTEEVYTGKAYHENKAIERINSLQTQNIAAKESHDKSKYGTKQENPSTGKIAGHARKTRSRRSGGGAGEPPANDNSTVILAENENRSGPVQKETSSIAKMSKIKPDTLPEDPQTLQLVNLKSSDTLLVGFEKKKSPFSTNSLKFQAGLGIEKANNQFGCSIIGELVVNKRFSISAGVKYLNIYNKQYRDDEDYDHQESKNFKSAYAPHTPDTSSIANIGVQFDLLQLPLALTYNQPLKRNYAMLFSVGTDIDLYAKQRLNYDRKDYNTPYEHQNLDVENPTVFFNNVVLSIGAQKQWNHFILQASSFLSPQIKEVDYKKNNLYYGLRIKTLYRF